MTYGDTSPVFSSAAQLSVKSSKVLIDSSRLQNVSEVLFRCQSGSEKRLLSSYSLVLTEQHDATPPTGFFIIIFCIITKNFLFQTFSLF